MKSLDAKRNNTLELTVVAASRNDDHGGNLLHRMQLFVSSLLSQCKRHGLKAELILVEWNPPKERPPLAEVLSWPADTGPCVIRIVEVSPEIHRCFENSHKLSLFQMIAKNVGIQRARGQFILATNVDILFSDELIQFLASGRLRRGVMYRVDRYDVPADIPTDVSIERQLEYCSNNLLRVHGRDATINFQTGDLHRIYPRSSVRNRIVDQFWKCIRSERLERCRIHTNASGDFTMMAQADWARLRGYPEFEMYSFHIDSLLCYMAYHAGVKEVVLRYPIFHIEHAAGWTPEVERDGSLYQRLDEAQIRRLSNEELDALTVQMKRERRPIIFNDDDWGMAEDDLPETIIRGRVNST